MILTLSIKLTGVTSDEIVLSPREIGSCTKLIHGNIVMHIPPARATNYGDRVSRASFPALDVIQR